MKLTLIGLQNYKQELRGRGMNNLVIRENTGEITVMFHEKGSDMSETINY